MNGDGFSDVLIGAPFAERWDRNEGLAFLFLRSKAGLQQKPAWIAESNHPHTLFGESLSTAGDVNGDGFSDVLVGMPQASHGQQTEGAVAAFNGAKRGLRSSAEGIIESDHTHENLGALVMPAGDVNGDGYADVLLVGPGLEQEVAEGVAKFRRVLLCYGSSQGLPFFHRWSLDKPLLIGIQQRLERFHSAFGTVAYWGPSTLLLLLVASVAVALKVRDQRRISNLLEENRALVSAQERARIARDVHDHIGADLTEIVLTAKQENVSVEGKLNAISSIAAKAFDNMDEVIWITNPEDDSVQSLAFRARDFVSEFAR